MFAGVIGVRNGPNCKALVRNQSFFEILWRKWLAAPHKTEDQLATYRSLTTLAIAKGDDVDFVWKRGNLLHVISGLHLPIYVERSRDVVSFLVNEGCDPLARDDRRRTPFSRAFAHPAIDRALLAILARLLIHGNPAQLVDNLRSGLGEYIVRCQWSTLRSLYKTWP